MVFTPLQPEVDRYITIEVSVTVVAVSAPTESVYNPELLGANRYHTLRVTLVSKNVSGGGKGGSPVGVASDTSTTGLRYGNAPEPGTTNAPAHVSLPGAAAKPPNGRPSKNRKRLSIASKRRRRPAGKSREGSIEGALIGYN